MFVDKAKIYVRSGKGGDGHVSFRRELYVPAGGPNGGDGGKGGDVIFEVEKGLNTLTDFRHIRKYAAGDGQPGGKNRCHGADGEDMIIKVPEGTIIKEENSGLVVADMSGDTQRLVLLKGGRGGHGNKREVVLRGGKGGKGNQHYATATMQVPMYAQPGQKAQELNLVLELKVIADVGLVGFPNVGKSTFLARVTNAKPKIANYHFTTLSPNLGVVDLDGSDGFVIADIPGIIEGASEGVGLGHEFLRHIERTRVIIHIVDAAGVEGRDPIRDIHMINKELEAYNIDLANRPQVIAANKIDALYDGENDDAITLLREEFEPEGIKVFPISAVSGRGVRELLYHVNNLLKELGEEKITFEREFFPEQVEENLPFTVFKSEEEEDVYHVEGPRVERMLGYTNLESEKGFDFFQKFMKDNGILDELEALGIQDGDTVKVFYHEFEYYK